MFAKSMGSGALRKGGRRKGGMMQEGRGGYACFEGVVHVGVLLGCLWMSLCGENAFVMRAKWSVLTRFAV
ncbi:hypothetical protein [Bartonella sp. CL100XZDX]|uniref:hypothetical protein n=1 Tax=Bartonella sp. CL100XZDX TaxID=3243515 RepID=UPI003857A7A9